MHFDRASRKAALSRLIARFFQNFLQGVVVLAPIGVTIWAVLFLFNSVDNILPSILHSIAPNFVGIDGDGNLKKIPGLGFIVMVTIVVIIGRISSLLFFNKVVTFFDKLLEKTPGINFIYSAVKDLMEAFAGNKKKFDRAVLVNVDGADVWRVGFITQESLLNFELENHVAVYVPHGYAISGILFFVPINKIKPLNNISAADAMKFAISGGVSEV